jgi:hypothetical protein
MSGLGVSSLQVSCRGVLAEGDRIRTLDLFGGRVINAGSSLQRFRKGRKRKKSEKFAFQSADLYIAEQSILTFSRVRRLFDLKNSDNN